MGSERTEQVVLYIIARQMVCVCVCIVDDTLMGCLGSVVSVFVSLQARAGGLVCPELCPERRCSPGPYFACRLMMGSFMAVAQSCALINHDGVY